jgi:hypothetical protein
MRKLFYLTVCIALIACEGPKIETASSTSDAEGKTFPPPPPGKAALYIAAGYIPDVSTISVGRSEVGSLSQRTWLRVDVDPGNHEIRARSPYSESSLSLAFTAGTTTFAQLQYVDLRPWSDVLSQVSSGQGRELVLAGKRAATLR